MDLALLDPDPYWEMAMQIWIKEEGNLPKFTGKPDF
jgi:hypothetical protein